MAKKIIKHRLFTWFENIDSPVSPGETVRVERISHFGEEVDITDEASLKRGEELDSFFSDKDAKAIKAGKYSGPEAALLANARGESQAPVASATVTDLDDEGPQTDNLSAAELGAHINDNKLNVDQTVALAKDGDEDSINKVYDAEEHAARMRDSEPRKGVLDRLDAMLTAAASGQDEEK